jgi:putative NADH-flavin reductase
MKIAMFGVTGTCGSPLLAATLDAGHEVHVLARAPHKVTRTDARVTPGDALDRAAVATAIAGCDAVLSTLGGFRGPASLSVGTRNILSAMDEYGVRRLVALQGIHLRLPQDQVNLGQRLIGVVMRVAGRAIVNHGEAMVQELLASRVDWTLVRIPRVTDAGPTGNARIGALRLGPWSHVTTGDVATTMLALVSTPDHVHAAPMLASGAPHPLGRPRPAITR